MSNFFNPRFFRNPFESTSSQSRSSQQSSSSSPSSPDFDYSDINSIPVSLQPSFNNLKKAINKKKSILEKYKGVYALLQSMDGLLDTYITNHAQLNEKLSNLQKEKDTLETERDNLNNQSRPEDQSKIEELNSQIEEKQKEITRLNIEQSANVGNMEAISKLLDEANSYIDNMYPADKSDVNNIQTLIDQMKSKLGNGSDSDNARFSSIYGDNNIVSGTNPMVSQSNRIEEMSGGYRYSGSSQLRRKSGKKMSMLNARSSSSSSSSNIRRVKKTKKNMLGGKRKMKKSKSNRSKRSTKSKSRRNKKTRR